MAYNVYFCCDKCGATYSWINNSISCLWPSELQEVKGGPLESAGGIAQNATKSVEEADNETD